jgi:LAS superfamily LD-carboxypeptidase LdcB
MAGKISKYKFPLLVLIFSLLLAILLSFFTLEQKKISEIKYQKFLQEQLALKEAEKKEEQKIYLMGKFDQGSREDFGPIPLRYTTNQNKMYLRKETLSAFLEMQKSAVKDGVDLKIASATRNFDYQKNIWNNKWTGLTLVDGKDLSKSIPSGLNRFKKILEYSSAPGTSRHHWGTDIDLNDANPDYFETEKGAEVYEWLERNANSFGFCQPYNQKGTERQTGYNEEKWHWSYLPLSKNFTQKYNALIKSEDIKGFLGDEYVPSLNLINDYVLGINPDCL